MSNEISFFGGQDLLDGMPFRRAGTILPFERPIPLQKPAVEAFSRCRSLLRFRSAEPEINLS